MSSTAIKETANITKGVVVVENNSETRLHLKKILISSNDFHLAGAFSNPEEALNRASDMEPDLMLLGVHARGSKGLEYIRRFKCILVSLKVIIITSMANADMVEASLLAGAESCLIKPVLAEQCLATLRFAGYIHGRDDWKSPGAEPKPSPGATSRKCLLLSHRENEVMNGLAEGLLYKEIADKLHISFSAVHKYQHHLFRKLHVSNRSEAIREWQRILFSGSQPAPQIKQRVAQQGLRQTGFR